MGLVPDDRPFIVLVGSSAGHTVVQLAWIGVLFSLFYSRTVLTQAQLERRLCDWEHFGLVQTSVPFNGM